jgi:hypothetical protein
MSTGPFAEVLALTTRKPYQGPINHGAQFLASSKMSNFGDSDLVSSNETAAVCFRGFCRLALDAGNYLLALQSKVLMCALFSRMK